MWLVHLFPITFRSWNQNLWNQILKFIAHLHCSTNHASNARTGSHVISSGHRDYPHKCRSLLIGKNYNRQIKLTWFQSPMAIRHHLICCTFISSPSGPASDPWSLYFLCSAVSLITPQSTDQERDSRTNFLLIQSPINPWRLLDSQRDNPAVRSAESPFHFQL